MHTVKCILWNASLKMHTVKCMLWNVYSESYMICEFFLFFFLKTLYLKILTNNKMIEWVSFSRTLVMAKLSEKPKTWTESFKKTQLFLYISSTIPLGVWNIVEWRHLVRELISCITDNVFFFLYIYIYQYFVFFENCLVSTVSKCHKNTHVCPRNILLTLHNSFRFVHANWKMYVFHP